MTVQAMFEKVLNAKSVNLTNAQETVANVFSHIKCHSSWLQRILRATSPIIIIIMLTYIISTRS